VIERVEVTARIRAEAKADARREAIAAVAERPEQTTLALALAVIAILEALPASVRQAALAEIPTPARTLLGSLRDIGRNPGLAPGDE
jgi:hypothetical protein